MSIVYILGEFPSSTEYFILNEIIELQKSGLDIKIFAVRKGPDIGERSLEIRGCVVYSSLFFSVYSFKAHFYLINSFLERYFKALWEIILSANWSISTFLKEIRNFTIAAQFLFKLRTSRATHIHAHFVSLPASIAYRMSQISGIPFSCSAHAHDIFTSDKAEIVRKLNAASFFVTCTSFNKKYLDSIVGKVEKEKIIHVYHGIDLNQWPQKDQLTFYEREIHILTIGRLVEKKGIIFLLEAVKLLIGRGHLLKCSIIGEGPLREQLEDYIRTNDLTEIACLYGALEQDAVKEFYRKADVFILPCTMTDDGDRDGLPNVLLEALAVGVPVISTPVSAISELIVDGQTGILVPDQDPEGIAIAVMRLIDTPKLSQSLSTNGRIKVEKEFSISASTDRLVQLFESF